MESIVEACTCSARSASSKNSDVSAPVLQKIQDIQEISFYDNCLPYSTCQPHLQLSLARECQTKPGRVWPRLTKHFDLPLVFQHLPSGLTFQVRDVLCSDLIIMAGVSFDFSDSKRSLQVAFCGKTKVRDSDVVTIKVFTSPSWATSLNQAHKKQVVSLSHQNLIQNHTNKMSVLNMENRWTLHQLSHLNLSFECRTLVARTRLPKLLASIISAYISLWAAVASLKRHGLNIATSSRLEEYEEWPESSWNRPSVSKCQQHLTTVHLTAGDVHRYSWYQTLSPPSVTLYSKSPNLPAKTGKAEAWVNS